MKTEFKHLTNREPIEIKDGKLAAGDILPGVQICPVGEWKNGEDEQHCTAEALARIVENWKQEGEKDILVDFEHQSEEGGTSDTSAAAWASNLRVDPERGLVGDFMFTDIGAEAVSNRRLRFLSVGWFVSDTTREPMKITSIALTNKPNIPVAPILNKEQPDNTHVEDKEKSMDKIKEALGLAPEATEDDVLNAIKASLAKNKEADEAAKKAQESALEKEAEEFAETNSKKCNKEVLKQQYIANKEVAKALVAGIPDAPAAQQQILNKGQAKEPVKSDLVKELNKLPAGEARVKFVTEHAAEFAAEAK